ncbi:MAG TPA: FAD-dependent oxidoreductase, partial [Chthoniobacteraceae bacterium]
MTTFALSFDVVIAGGGFAGVACAQQLAKEFGTEGPKRVALISDQNFMVFQPMLAEVVGSSISPRHIVNPIRRLARVTVLRGNITDADLGTRQLTLEAGDFAGTVSVSFQHLVLTLGGVVDLSRVPGMPEHAFLMKNVGDALKLRATIIDRFEEANLESDPAERRRLLTFVIVGGGYSGVETAGQINDLGEEILSFYPRLARDEFRVVLIHSQAHLLPEISEALGRYCEDHLLSRSVELMLNTRVTAMTAGRVLLGDGREIESHTVVSTVGNAPHPLLSRLCKAGAFDCAKGRIICDQTLRVVGQQHLWAAGDCAAVPMPAPTTNSPTDPHTFCPPTAQFATRQGKLLGENIARTLDHAREPKPFTFTGLGELASIGHRAAVADIMGV